MLTLLGTVDEAVAFVVATWDAERATAEAGRRRAARHQDQKPRPPRHRRERDQGDHDADVLTQIPPSDYVEALTGVYVPASGVIHCVLPDHDERTPSFKAYPDPERGWFCFGCGRGGSIFDFGAALWSMSIRGPGFHDLRRRLAAELLRSAAA